MSVRRAFKLAVVEYLGQFAGYDKGAVAITGAGGRPRPDCGDWFVGVWGGGRSYGIKTAVDITQAVNITLTRRLTEPLDRLDIALDAEADGFDERVDKLVCLLMAGQNDIRERAANLLPDGVDGSSEAPRVLSDSPDAEECGAEWFGAAPETGQKGVVNVYGLRGTIVYGGLRVTHPWNTANL